MIPPLAAFLARLADYDPKAFEIGVDWRRAAVAMLLRDSQGGPEVLLVRRAARAGDPWSGQISFPGGRMEATDASEERAAVRETMEEVGVDLDTCARLAGRLTPIQARSRAGMLPLSIHPFVYELLEPVEARPVSEVVDAFWIPLQFFRERRNRSTMRHKVAEKELVLPCYPWSGDVVIWGLSLAMLDELVFRVVPE